MKIKLLFAFAMLLGFQGQAQSSTFTNLVVLGIGQSVSLNVKTGQLARVVCVNGLNGNSRMIVDIGTTSFNYDTLNYNATSTTASQGPPAVAGPAKITLSTLNAGGRAFCTIEIVTPSEPLTPSTGVVIPAD